jgi:hypothetical protein
LNARGEFALKPNEHDGVDAEIGHNNGNRCANGQPKVSEELCDICGHLESVKCETFFL